MVDSSVPGDDTRRLQNIHSLKVLDIQPEARFERVTCMARRLFDVPIAALCLDDRARETRAHIDAIEMFEAARTHAYASDEDVLVVADAAAEARFDDSPPVLDGHRARFYAGCPVHSPDGDRMGTLCLLDTEPRTFSVEDVALLKELGGMVSDVFRSLAIATSDALTKLANRRGFEDIAAHIVPLASRHGLPLSLAQLDLDGLKQINDVHGHEAGDRTLVAFARHLLKNFRESDVVARLGGDEFCVLLSGASERDVAAGLKRLEAVLSAEADEPIRFSAGVAELDPQRHAGVGDLLREADQRMYECKRRKRDSDPAAVTA